MSLHVIGLDGGPLPPGARDALAAAQVVAGGRRHLASAPVPDAAERVELGPVDPALEKLAGRRAVVLASGDPGFFGIVRLLRERGHDPVVLPALSSVRSCSAPGSAGRGTTSPWSARTAGTLGPAVNVCRARAATAVLTAPGAGPAEIGAALDGLAAHARRRPRTWAARASGSPTLPAAEAAAPRLGPAERRALPARPGRRAGPRLDRRRRADAAPAAGRCRTTRSRTAPG